MEYISPDQILAISNSNSNAGKEENVSCALV